jgi:hypothetical protein
MMVMNECMMAFWVCGLIPCLFGRMEGKGRMALLAFSRLSVDQFRHLRHHDFGLFCVCLVVRKYTSPEIVIGQSNAGQSAVYTLTTFARTKKLQQ